RKRSGRCALPRTKTWIAGPRNRCGATWRANPRPGVTMSLEAVCEWLAVLFFAMAGVALLRKPPAKKTPAPGFLDWELDVLPGIPFTGKMATEGVYVIAELGWGKTWLTFMR